MRELDLMDWERKVEWARELETLEGVRELGLMERAVRESGLMKGSQMWIC